MGKETFQEVMFGFSHTALTVADDVEISYVLLRVGLF